MHTKFWQEKTEGTKQLGDLGIDGKIIRQGVLGRYVHLLSFNMFNMAMTTLETRKGEHTYTHTAK
jgi:hypothetical protein